jgi:hypothetical protein
MIHNVYRMQNLSSTSSKNQPQGKSLLHDTHRVFSFISAAISDASANPVLGGDFNIYHPN